MEETKFHVGEFEGPLDLLLFLIRKQEINIYDIPIARITEQYLEYLAYATEIELEDLTEFYVMAATLLLIKSRMLLPVEIDFESQKIFHFYSMFLLGKHKREYKFSEVKDVELVSTTSNIPYGVLIRIMNGDIFFIFNKGTFSDHQTEAKEIHKKLKPILAPKKRAK